MNLLVTYNGIKVYAGDSCGAHSITGFHIPHGIDMTVPRGFTIEVDGECIFRTDFYQKFTFTNMGIQLYTIDDFGNKVIHDEKLEGDDV